jgi:hypothetical protein
MGVPPAECDLLRQSTCAFCVDSELWGVGIVEYSKDDR